MKTSIQRLIDFDVAAANYLARHDKEDTKFKYAINRIVSQIKTANTKFNETLAELFSDIRLDHCLTDPPDDPKGKILRSATGDYEFTRDGERACKKALTKARSEAMNREDIEITPHFVSQAPNDLTDDELRGFSGFVIKAEQVDSILKEREEPAEQTNGHIPGKTIETEATV